MKRNKHNKILASICLILLAPIFLNAQNNKPKNLPNYDNEPFHWGFIIGYNQSFFRPTYVDNFQYTPHDMSTLPYTDGFSEKDAKEYFIDGINPEIGHGFGIGCITNFRIAKYFDLRIIPTFIFGSRYVTYDINVVNKDGKSIHKTKIKSSNGILDLVNIEIPINLKYRSVRYNNCAAYIFTGPNLQWNAISLFNNSKEDHNIQKTLKTKIFDIAFEGGVGFDFYTGYTKIGVELKMSYGLFDMLTDKKKESIYTNSFNSLKNKAFQLSFTFN